jgi:hypothetical protein
MNMTTDVAQQSDSQKLRAGLGELNQPTDQAEWIEPPATLAPQIIADTLRELEAEKRRNQSESSSDLQRYWLNKWLIALSLAIFLWGLLTLIVLALISFTK